MHEKFVTSRRNGQREFTFSMATWPSKVSHTHIVRTQGIEFKLRIKCDQQNLAISVCTVIFQEIDKSKFIIGFVRLHLFLVSAGQFGRLPRNKKKDFSRVSEVCVRANWNGKWATLNQIGTCKWHKVRRRKAESNFHCMHLKHFPQDISTIFYLFPCVCALSVSQANYRALYWLPFCMLAVH